MTRLSRPRAARTATRTVARTVAAALAATGLLGVAACGGGTAEQVTADGAVTVQFWYGVSGAAGDYLKQKVAEFNDAHRGRITVEASYQGGYEDTFAKLAASIQTGDVPTLMQASDVQSAYMRDSGIVEPVQDLLGADGRTVADGLLPIVRNYYETAGTLWSMPMFVSQPVMYLNNAVLREAGVDPAGLRTFDDVLGAAQTIHRVTGRAGLTFPVDSWWAEQFAAASDRLWCTPGNGVGDTRATALNADDPALLDLWDRLAAMYADGSLANLGTSGDKLVGALSAGTVGILFNSSGGLSAVEKAKIDVTVAPMPRVSDRTGSAPGGNSLWVLKEGKDGARLRAAAEFVRFVGSAAFQGDVLKTTGYLPSTAEAAQAARASADANRRVLLDNEARTPATPVTAGCHLGALNEVRADVRTAMARIAAGESPREQFAEVQDKAETAVRRYETRVDATQK